MCQRAEIGQCAQVIGGKTHRFAQRFFRLQQLTGRQMTETEFGGGFRIIRCRSAGLLQQRERGAGIALLAVIVWYGLIYAGRIGGQPVPAFGFLLDDLFGTGDLAPSFYWVYLGLPVGMALLALRMAVETAIIARGLGARGETER